MSAEVEAVAGKLKETKIVENGKSDDYWGFSLHEAFKMAIKFYKGAIIFIIFLRSCLFND